jgi:hypothetical protein
MKRRAEIVASKMGGPDLLALRANRTTSTPFFIIVPPWGPRKGPM